MKIIIRFLRKTSKKPKGKPDLLRRITVWICDKTGGHEASNDVGYAGGGMLDTWCKHCDAMFQIPLKEKKISEPFGNLIKVIREE